MNCRTDSPTPLRISAAMDAIPLVPILMRSDAPWRRLVPRVSDHQGNIKRNANTAGRRLRLDSTVTYGWASQCCHHTGPYRPLEARLNYDEPPFYCPKYERNYRQTAPTHESVGNG